MKDRAAAAIRPNAPASGTGAGAASAANGPADAAPADTQQPAWAKRLHRRQQISHAASTVAHTLRGGDGGGSGSSPSLRDPSDS
jgi:type IV secretion system protein TrbL